MGVDDEDDTATNATYCSFSSCKHSSSCSSFTAGQTHKAITVRSAVRVPIGKIRITTTEETGQAMLPKHINGSSGSSSIRNSSSNSNPSSRPKIPDAFPRRSLTRSNSCSLCFLRCCRDWRHLLSLTALTGSTGSGICFRRFGCRSWGRRNFSKSSAIKKGDECDVQTFIRSRSVIKHAILKLKQGIC